MQTPWSAAHDVQGWEAVRRPPFFEPVFFSSAPLSAAPPSAAAPPHHRVKQRGVMLSVSQHPPPAGVDRNHGRVGVKVERARLHRLPQGAPRAQRPLDGGALPARRAGAVRLRHPHREPDQQGRRGDLLRARVRPRGDARRGVPRPRPLLRLAQGARAPRRCAAPRCARRRRRNRRRKASAEASLRPFPGPTRRARAGSGRRRSRASPRSAAGCSSGKTPSSSGACRGRPRSQPRRVRTRGGGFGADGADGAGLLPCRGGVPRRSDSNGEDLEGFAGAGLYDSITMKARPPATPVC